MYPGGNQRIIDHGVLRLSDIPELEEAHLLDALRTVAQQRPIYMTYDCQYRVYGAYKDAGYTSETLTLLFCMRNVLAGTASVIGGRIVSGKNGFAGMTGYMPWGMSQEEQIQVIAQGSPKGLELIVKTALSVIAVLNPDELLFAGNVVDREMMEAVQTACAKAVPPEFLPKLRLADHRGDQYYLEGMYQKALEMKADLAIEYWQ